MLYVAPNLVNSELRSAIQNRSTVTVTASIDTDSVEVRGLGNQSRYRVQITILEPKAFSGSSGSLTSNKEYGLSSGAKVRAVISLKPAFKNDEVFSATLKHVLDSKDSRSIDYLAFIRMSFLNSLQGITTDSAALVAGLDLHLGAQFLGQFFLQTQHITIRSFADGFARRVP